jgi:flagellar hook assembly protein FlgD
MKNQNLDIQIQIFTIGGRLVKTIEDSVYTDGRRVSGINWDGTDDYGGQLGKGVYLYKVKVKADSTGTSESDFEKLVILK